MKRITLGHHAGRRGGLGLMLGAALVAVAGFSNGVTAQTLTTLYSFAPLPDGASPFDTPIAVAGNLYGTTFSGGSAVCTGGCGTVFKLTPSRNDRRWRETVLYGFTGSDGTNPAAGLNPVAGLIADAAGNLYGTTEFGGGASGCSGGCGTVFKVTPSGTETVLHSFTGSDGASPVAGLIADAAGNLYGTTELGGGTIGCSGGCGTVFKVTPKGVESVLYSFKGGSDGANPFAALIADAAGNLYGTTFFGGASGKGTVFKLTPSGAESVLYSFTGENDGANPLTGLIADAAGNFYGMTNNGGTGMYGTVFKLTPKGKLTVLHSFAGGTDGAFPGLGSLIADVSGNLYGMTVEGGVGGTPACFANGAIGCGTVFKLTPSGTETVLYSFTGGSDGGFPHAGLTAALIPDTAGKLYGMTINGGGPASGGTVFEIADSGFVFFAGTQGKPNCAAQSVSALEQQYGGLAAAATALGTTVQALQNDIAAYCAG
jgi:uncharacterized repeat protein (TIGR03803 family)